MSDSTGAQTLVEFLQGDAARRELERLASAVLADEETLRLLDDLRKRFPAEEASALLKQARLRRRAHTKFPHADRMLFVEEALEQATAHAVAEHRAAQLHAWSPAGAALDLGCGIGGDLLALAQYRPVVGYEIDPLRAQLARANVAVVGTPHAVEVLCADWTEALAVHQLPAAAAAFADPARRIESAGRQRQRVFSLHAMQPPITTLLALAQRVSVLAVKVAPGVQDAELPAHSSVEWVSHLGVCKEAVLWFGAPEAHRRWASVHAGDRWHTIASSGDEPPRGLLQAGMTLYEPDPAVIRAGALAELCAALDAWQFDAQIAYLVGERAEVPPPIQPFVTAFHVREVHPFGLHVLNQRLAALDIGSVELKKRGFPTEPEELRPRLKLRKGGGQAVIILTRLGDEHLMLICDRIGGTPAARKQER